MLIIEASGDTDRTRDRFEAISTFSRENAEVDIQVFYSDKVILPDSLSFGENVTMNPSKSTYRSAARMLSSQSDAVLVSAGDTRKVVATSIITCGLTHEYKTPPVLGAIMPKRHGQKFIFLDVGGASNFNNTHLVWSALSGKIISEVIFGSNQNHQAKVGLLNIGSEEGKGGQELEEIRRKLSDMLGSDFIGNIEINYALKSIDLDVLVAPGFVGNNTLKTIEGIMELQKETVVDICKEKPWLSPAGLLMRYLSKLFWKQYSWRDYAGAYLMGIKKPVIVTHGRCDMRAFLVSLYRANDPLVFEIWKRQQTDPLIQNYLKD